MGNNSGKKEMTFEERVADLRTKQRTLTGVLVEVRKPTIAALPGPAAGAGMAIALACDIRIAAESAIMSTGYARIGLTGDYGIAWLLTRLVGTSRARELMFLSERIDARRCEALGLVNRVVGDAELREAAFALAKSLAEGPSIALARIKDNMRHRSRPLRYAGNQLRCGRLCTTGLGTCSCSRPTTVPPSILAGLS
jgi:enoyl-CoA hydratase/carnithine racemase